MTNNNQEQKTERTFGLQEFSLSVLKQMWSVVKNDNTEFSHAIKRQIDLKTNIHPAGVRAVNVKSTKSY